MPSKEQHTGDVIAELTAGKEVGETGEKISEHEAWSGYLVTAYHRYRYTVILLKWVYGCQTCFFT